MDGASNDALSIKSLERTEERETYLQNYTTEILLNFGECNNCLWEILSAV